MLFSAGLDGSINVWMLPEDEEEQYAQTNGNSHMIGTWTDKVEAPYWQISYHPFTNLLLAVKAGKSAQIWSTEELVNYAKRIKDGDEEKTFDQESPSKEFPLSIEDQD